MKKIFLEIVLFTAGAVLFVGILRHFGFEATFSTLAKAGPGVFAVLLLYPFMSMFDVLSWRFCFGEAWVGRARFVSLFFIRLAGEALNNITPFIDIGGEPLKAHLCERHLGIPIASAVSSTVVSRTSLLLSEALFMFSGLALSFWLMPLETKSRWELVLALGVVCAAFLGFLFVQQKEWLRKLNPEIARHYADERPRFVRAVFFNCLGWIAGGCEMFLFCRLMGMDVSLIKALMLESLLQLVRVASFFIPGNLGAQEGGLAFFIGQLGYDPVIGLGLSLLKRFRQLLWTAVGFVIWGFYRYRDPGTK